MTSIKWPVSEAELEKNYSRIMQKADNLSFNKNKRRDILWKNWPNIRENAGSWSCLRELHIMLFDGIFDFAGQIRTKNLIKGSFRFANALFLEANLPLIERMPQKTFDEILEKYIEMNIAHPFREGNGRATRLWLDAMLEKELNTRVNWSMIKRDNYISAMQRSAVNSLELSTLLKSALIEPEFLSDKIIFMAGLSASYAYESD